MITLCWTCQVATSALLVHKSNSITALDRPWGFQEGKASRFQDNRHMKVVRLAALHTGQLYPQKIFLVLISVRGWVNLNAAGRIMSIKYSRDTIGYRTRDLPACRAVPQSTAPPRAPLLINTVIYWYRQEVISYPISREVNMDSYFANFPSDITGNKIKGKFMRLPFQSIHAFKPVLPTLF